MTVSRYRTREMWTSDIPVQEITTMINDHIEETHDCDSRDGRVKSDPQRRVRQIHAIRIEMIKKIKYGFQHP